MRTQAEIENSITAALPILFGKADAVDESVFSGKFDSLLAAIGPIVGPFLSAETVRYQSILLASSVFLMSIVFFRWGYIKLLDNAVTVDRKVLVIYSIFVGAVALIFTTKAYVDVQRTRLTPSVSAKLAAELNRLIQVGALKKQIENYFWTKMFDAIGRSYGLYQESRTALRGEQTVFKHIEVSSVFKMDMNDSERFQNSLWK
jgi:hypothetical protein